MDKYFKMTDVFKGKEVKLPEQWSYEMVTHAAHAINSHDDLVAEVERLRRQLAYSFMAGWEEGINEMEHDEAERLSIEIAAQFARN